jgi:hypothetical protein
MADKKLVVLVHGWSVTSTETYGQLPDRLEVEAAKSGDIDIDIKNIWLGKYVSFRDEVRVEDVARAFEAAIRRELGAELDAGRRFAAITHSTGGPVMRDWWNRFYASKPGAGPCPMSHLIMLAPANFGSALAQLGASAIGRLQSWFEGVQPGTGVLDWLELGSPESWRLNQTWAASQPTWIGAAPVFPFVLTGQSIDRKFYDHVNSYTGEIGSDGVVRVASANLNMVCARLVQSPPRLDPKAKKPQWIAPELVLDGKPTIAPRTALAVLPGFSHSGKEMGILRSIKRTGAHATVDAVLTCLRVKDAAGYSACCDAFDALTAKTQADELIEKEDGWFHDAYFVHDRRTQLIVRLSDDHGYTLDNFDFLLLGPEDDPNHLPQGFFADRQRNRRNKGTVTYFLNYDVMHESGAVVADGRTLREASPGASELGFQVDPRPEDGFVHYLSAQFEASGQTLSDFVKPNQTLLLDVVLRRVVREGVFGLDQERKPRKFSGDPPGAPIVGSDG